MNKRQTFINLFISVLSNIIILIMGFIIPRILLTHYGSDTNGLISTISQIFTYVALLEAGISQATLNALYKPLHDKDKQSTINVLFASRKYYRHVTHLYATLVIVLSIILPFIIKSELSYFTISLAVFFEGASGVVSFYFIQTPSILLTADGKTYIKSIIELVIKFGGYGIKIILALMGFSIVYIQLGYFLLSLVKVLLYYIVIQKKYKWLDYTKCDNKNLKLPNRNDFVVSELAWTFFSSTDLIVLSIFASTKMSSVYSVNNMAFLALNNLLNAAYYAIYYLLGKTYYTDMNQYRKIHDAFNSFFMGLVTVFMGVGLLLAGPFIKLYTAGVTDTEYNLYWLPFCFCVIQILSWSRYVSGNLSGIAGYAKQVSHISLLEAFINVFFSVILVNIWGIYGVVIATIAALPIKVIYTNYIADKVIMKRSVFQTIKILGINYLLFAGIVFVRSKITFNINNYFSFVVHGIILVAIIGLITLCANFLVNPFIFSSLKRMLRKR